MMHSLVSILSPMALGLMAKVTLLLVAGALVAVALRRQSAAVRHFVWALVLSGALVLPFLSGVAPRLVVPVEQPRAWSQVVPRAGGGPQSEIMTPRLAAERSSQPESSGMLADGAGLVLRPRAASLSVAGWLVLVWLVGDASILVSAVLGHAGLGWLARRAQPLEGEMWRRLLGASWARTNPPRPVRLCSSPAVGAPVTWGWVHPVVVLPANAATWPEDRRRVALDHELAHIARRDYLFQVVATLACALYWFHPLAWFAARRLRAESEQACDDRVLASGTRGSDYATHLLEVARSARALWLGGSVAVCMARPSQLEGRLLALLDEARPRGSVSVRKRVAAVAALALALVPFAGLRPELRAAQAAPPTSHATDIAADAGRQEKTDDSGAESPYEKTFAATPGGRLTLDLDTGGDVNLQGWDKKEVRVRARLGGTDWRDTRVSAEEEEGGIRVSSRQGAHGSSFSTSHDFEIWVPKRYDLRLRSAGGDVTIRDVEGNLRGQTGGGEITLEHVAGQVNLSTGGGDIRVTDADASGSVSTGGGSVQMSRVRGGLHASSGSGPIVYSEATDAGGSKRSYGDLSDVEVDNSGRIEDTRSGAAGMLTIERAGGEVVLHEAPHGARITTGGGDIRVGRAGGSVEASTGGGDIEIGPAAGSVVAGTGAGDVQVTLATGGGHEQEVEINSGTGRVVLVLPADLDARFDLETAYTRNHTSTRIESSWKLKQEATSDWDDSEGTPRRYVRAQGVAGKGSGLIHVRTVNGDILVRRTGKK
jgi:beta-lactamase regulating signal transducer with metallopeptidase domain/DUF4097 and DUF4098 domain-containing protein YvlB